MYYPIHDQPLPARCPVIYLPGIDGTGRLLFRQTALSEKHDLHSISYPQDVRHTYADLVRLGIKKLEGTGPAVVLAESFGGAIALMIALERPDLIRRLVLVSTFSFYPRRLPIEFLSYFGLWLPNSPSHPSTRSVRSYFFFGPGIPQADQDAWWEMTADVPMRVYGHRFTLIANLDLRSKLREIEIPTLVFAAPNDWVVPFSASSLLAARMPRATLRTARTGHAAMIDPRVNIAEWLAGDSRWT